MSRIKSLWQRLKMKMQPKLLRMKRTMLAIDRSGNLEHQSSVMLAMLRSLLEKKECVVAVFDTSRKEPKYFASVTYTDLQIAANQDG